MNADYEEARRILLERQTEEALADEEHPEFKRHHDYIERLKGREPGPGTELLRVLTVVRSKSTPMLTSDVAIARCLTTQVALQKLDHLMQRGLIARQRPMLIGVGSWESSWTPERTESWPPK
jgi:hypothetical protein